MNEVVKIIKKYPEQIILGVCILATLVVFVSVLNPSEDEIIGRVRSNAEKFKIMINTKEPPPLAEIKYLESIRHNWDVITPTQECNNWLMYRPTVYEIKWADAGTSDGRVVINLPPIFKTITPTFPDTVELNWMKNEGTTADIKGYRIYRKSEDNKSFTRVIELSTEALTPTSLGIISYHDRPLSPTAEYTYYITSYTDAKNVKDNKQESDQSSQLQGITPADITIEFNGATSIYVMFKVGKYRGWWTYERGQCGKGETAGKDKSFTIVDIILFEEKVIKSGMEIIEKRYKITYRNNTTGEINTADTKALE